MLGAALGHVCAFLEDLQLKAMSGKMHKLEVEDREKMLNYAGMEREASFLQEILHLEELVVGFTKEKREVESELKGVQEKAEANDKKLVDLGHRWEGLFSGFARVYFIVLVSLF